MRRFCIDPHAITDDLAILSASESRHIAAVLRLVKGTQVELFDGTGVVYQGRLETVSKKEVIVRLLGRRKETEPMSSPIFLFQSLLKGKKMDFLIQKATEMGVHTIQPILTRYSEALGNPDRVTERWNRIMLEACKQCTRTRPMIINPLLELKNLSANGCGTQLMLWEGEKSVSLAPDLLATNRPVCLLLGPEGGFHGEEVELAEKLGFQTVSLGRHILRAETATIAALAIVQYLLGGFSPPAQPSPG